MMTQIILQCQIHLALNIQHRVVLLLITCLLVGAEIWQRGATKNDKVWCEEARTYALDWWQPCNVGTDERWSCRRCAWSEKSTTRHRFKTWLQGCFTIRVHHLSHFWWKMKCFVIPQHAFFCVMNKPYVDYIKLLTYRHNLSWIQLK